MFNDNRRSSMNYLDSFCCICGMFTLKSQKLKISKVSSFNLDDDGRPRQILGTTPVLQKLLHILAVI